MKSPTSIVNTLLESDYTDYDPSLDPYRNPKNVSHADLGHTYVSSADASCRTHWIYLLRGVMLLPKDTFAGNMSPEQETTVASIKKIYIKLGPVTIPVRECIWPNALTPSARRRVEVTLGPPSTYRYWPVIVVSVEYK